MSIQERLIKILEKHPGLKEIECQGMNAYGITFQARLEYDYVMRFFSERHQNFDLRCMDCSYWSILAREMENSIRGNPRVTIHGYYHPVIIFFETE